jgi:hypothetical protein
MSTVTAISFKPKATRKRLKKEILSDETENVLEKYCGKCSVWENFLWKIFHLTSLVEPCQAQDRFRHLIHRQSSSY